MLPAEHRLKRTRDFTRTRRLGRATGSPLAALYVAPTRLAVARVGFSVSKKIGKATVRNRVKRLMREAVRHQLPEILPAQDLVFIARPAAAEATYAQVAETVDYLLRKAGATAEPARRVHNA